MARVQSGWRDVWASIDARRDELGMSLADLYRHSGVSETTFTKMRKDGVPVKRGEKLTGICAALRWTPGSIDRLLRGAAPVNLPADESGTTFGEDLIERVENLSARFDDLAARVEALERQQRHTDPPSKPAAPTAGPPRRK